MSVRLLGEVTCPECKQVRVIKVHANDTSTEKLCRSCANSHARRRQGHLPSRSLICVICGETFVARGYRVSAKFCSQTCHGKAMRTKREKKGNPNFRHGNRAGNHIRGWSPKDKGESVCRACGSSVGLALHHIIPRGKWKAGRNDLRNGVPLCAGHHTRWHHGHRELTRNLFTDEEWSFVSSADLTGEVTEAWLDRHYPTTTS